jgi:FixJ family two-component response regulator
MWYAQKLERYAMEARVFVIDDDQQVRSSLQFLFEAAGMKVETFASATAFLERPPYDGPFCLVLDLRLPGLDGLSVQERLTGMGGAAPIVFLSGHSDVPTTAKAMRNGAVDFLVKPVDDSALLSAVNRALARAATAREQQREQTDVAARLARLTARERQVIDLVARGLLNKQIAFELRISEETVKVHRGHAMRKLELDSVPALVRLLDRSFT